MAEVAAIDPIDLRTFPAVAPLSVIPDVWRQTFIAKHTGCPRSAYLYLKYNGGPLTHPLAGGTLLHRAIEAFINHLIEHNERMGTPEMAKDILNETLAASPDLTVSPARFDQLRAMMFHIAEGIAIEPENVIGPEAPVSIEVNGRRLSGTVDFAEIGVQQALVIDWKSAFLNPPRPIDDPDQDVYMDTQEEWLASFQVVLYALMLAFGEIDGSPFNLSHIDEFVLRQIHPRHFWENEGTVAYREAIITREALLDWKLYLESVVGQIEKAFETWLWPAVIGSHCDYCPASAECPIPASLREYRGEIRTPGDAERAAVLWERMSRVRGEIWTALKGYAKATGKPIRYGADLELRWRTIHTEKIKDRVNYPGSKKKVKGRLALREAVERARDEGRPFEWFDFWVPSTSTRLSRRKLTDKELAEEKEGQDG